MKRENIQTKLGTFNTAIRAGEPLIVFLNSFGDFDNAQSFQLVIDQLPKNFGVMAPDYLNSGFSSPSLINYSISQEAHELAQIINSVESREVIVVAHSIGGVYASYLLKEIKNLKGFLGIEPTTREIILNPPQTSQYQKKLAEQQQLTPEEEETFIKNKIIQNFPAIQAEEFWGSTLSNASKFDPEAKLQAQKSLEQINWNQNEKISADIPTIIATEDYRADEYRRSEFFSANKRSKVISVGTFHYIHWEEPAVIANLIKELL